MIVAAGMGTRLLHLTKNKPKALVELHGKPLLQLQIEKLIAMGFNEIIVNVHHFADQIIHFLQGHEDFGIRILVSNESDLLLDTGGGLQKASWFFDDNKPFIVHNVDVLTNLDIMDMLNVHSESGALSTLAVRSRSTSRYLIFDEDNTLCGWKNLKTGEKIMARETSSPHDLAFSGVHCISPAIFDQLTETGRFSIINTYLRLAKSNVIKAYRHPESSWLDVGKPGDLAYAENNPDLFL